MKFLAIDAHSQHCELAVLNEQGKLIQCRSIPTSERGLIDAVRSVTGPKKLTIEEGSMTGWLALLLKPYVDELIVADPKQNHWISKNEQKDDVGDATRLAQLLRLGVIKPVYHSQDQRWVEFRSLMQHHQDLTQHLVRTKNQLKAHIRSVGIACSGTAIYQSVDDEEQLAEWLEKIQAYPQLQFEVRQIVRLLAQQMDLLEETNDQIKKQSQQWPIIEAWQRQQPGVGLIVASTVAAALITPERFSKKSKLCAYAGLSVFQQRSAGKVLRSGATRGGNRDLKRALMQAANAIGRMKADKHELASCYQSLKSRGLSALTAQRATARRLLFQMVGQWKRALVNQPKQPLTA
jgi:transposase